MTRPRHRRLLASVGAVCAVAAGTLSAALAPAEADSAAQGQPVLTVYSGRSEALVGPVLESFEKSTGVDLRVRYGETAELAALLLNEGQRTPAHIFFAQDAGALGALAREGRLSRLPDEVLMRVDSRFRSPLGEWVGVTGRARTLVYNTSAVNEADLPESVLDLTNPKWKGRIGWAPANGSFQAFITAMRIKLGDEKTEQWLRGIMANNPTEYPKNSEIVRAVGAGEVDVGLVNHYYLYRFTSANPDFAAANHFFTAGGPGALVNVAGVGVLKRAGGDEQTEAAVATLVQFLLSEEAQRHFATETHEYPLIEEVEASDDLVPLSEIRSPDIDLSNLDDLQGTLALLRKVGALP